MDTADKTHAQKKVSQRVYEDMLIADAAKEGAISERAADYEAIASYRASNPRLLRRPEVEARTGLSRSTLYDWMKRGDFPQPVKLGTRLVAWRESDVTAWLESREPRVA